jgi:hypothetical protein
MCGVRRLMQEQNRDKALNFPKNLAIASCRRKRQQHAIMCVGSLTVHGVFGRGGKREVEVLVLELVVGKSHFPILITRGRNNW